MVVGEEGREGGTALKPISLLLHFLDSLPNARRATTILRRCIGLDGGCDRPPPLILLPLPNSSFRLPPRPPFFAEAADCKRTFFFAVGECEWARRRWWTEQASAAMSPLLFRWPKNAPLPNNTLHHIVRSRIAGRGETFFPRGKEKMDNTLSLLLLTRGK